MAKKFDLVDIAIKIDEGSFESEEEYIESWQYLIDTGIAWQWQGRIGREAIALIDAGWCTPPAGFVLAHARDGYPYIKPAPAENEDDEGE